MRKSKIAEYFKWLLDNYGDMREFLENYLLGENVRDDDFSGLRLFIGIANVLLLSEAIKLKKTKFEMPEIYYDIFRKYKGIGMKYVSILYNPDRLRLYYGSFEDHEDRFFAALHYAAESTAKGDSRAGIKYFKEAARAYPYLVCYMKRYSDELFPELHDTIEEDE